MSNEKSLVPSGTTMPTTNNKRIFDVVGNSSFVNNDSIFRYASSITGEVYKKYMPHAESYFSAKSEEIMKIVDELKIKPSFSSQIPGLNKNASLNETLFDARAKAKILTSQVSMHLNQSLREKIFKQVDLLHDAEDWERDDVPVNEASFKSFLSALIHLNPERGPGLGLTYTGNVIASWSNGANRLVIEFMPNNVKWIITLDVGGEKEHYTGFTKVNHFFDKLSHFNLEQWFAKKG